MSTAARRLAGFIARIDAADLPDPVVAAILWLEAEPDLSGIEIMGAAMRHRAA